MELDEEREQQYDLLTAAIIGAAVGAGCGVVFPLLHRRGGPLSSNSVSIAAQGPGFALSGRF